LEEPLLELLETLKAIEDLQTFEDGMSTAINVVDLVFHDLNITVLNQALDFVDSNTSENVKSQR